MWWPGIMPSIKCLENQANGLSRYKQQSDLTDPADDFLFAAVFQGKLERHQTYSAILLPFHLVPNNNVASGYLSSYCPSLNRPTAADIRVRCS